ncbi:Oxysterol-binding protein-related protein 1C [Zea mays]|uniref:Oxysterol-binding protein-related protein 1C n=1 Tax=Zea mays TaxID=4577 RepID=A0A1D6GJR5_MAIZE|nr:Oxysterol-binding protein-related protein 1C [Zea mays]
MHPFCCAPLVPVSPAASAAPAASSAVAGTQAVMPPPQPPPLPPPPPRNNSATGGERRARAAGVSGGGGGDSSPLEGVKLNEIVGGGISGIMYKWVNYGRGWRPRWFALHEGVLSFYKIHGPDRIILSRETERGAKVIGEESLRRLNRPSAFSPSHSNGHSERIVREEFEALHKQLVLAKQKHALLLETLRQLKTEKVDLENTLVDESQRQSKEYGSASKPRHEKYSEGSASESDDYNEPQDPAEETDDEANLYFDTRDFLSSSSFKSSGSDFQRSEAGSDDEDDYPMDGINPSMKSIGVSYAYVRRRNRLPDPVEKEKGVSLWSMIKDNIGKDLTKVCLPVYFNEPLSSLQKCFEDLEYSYLIDRASEWGKRVLLLPEDS